MVADGAGLTGCFDVTLLYTVYPHAQRWAAEL